MKNFARKLKKHVDIMSKSLCKENTSVCIPKIEFGVLTFETRFFEMGGDICEIIGVTSTPHLIDFKYKGEIITKLAKI